MHDSQVYRQRIARVAVEVRSLAVPDELFASRAFVQIYEGPDVYQSAAIAMVLDPNVSAYEKEIVGYSMQNLPVRAFVSFASQVADSVERQITPMQVLEATAFPLLNIGKQRLVVHYQEPLVRNFLERLARMDAMPDTRKAYIRNDVLTGNALREYTEYLETLGRKVLE